MSQAQASGSSRAQNLAWNAPLAPMASSGKGPSAQRRASAYASSRSERTQPMRPYVASSSSASGSGTTGSASSAAHQPRGERGSGCVSAEGGSTSAASASKPAVSAASAASASSSYSSGVCTSASKLMARHGRGRARQSRARAVPRTSRYDAARSEALPLRVSALGGMPRVQAVPPATNAAREASSAVAGGAHPVVERPSKPAWPSHGPHPRLRPAPRCG